jgi:7-cyano-7-deazaguanine synthase
MKRPGKVATAEARSIETSQGRATILMSGGIDSAACAHLLGRQGFVLDGVFLNYGQAAAKFELIAADAIALELGIPLQCFSLAGSEPFGPGELVGRNGLLIFASLFLTRARPGLLALGLHAGSTYFDCSEAFLRSIGSLVSEHTDGQVSVIAPFISWTKKDVFDYFANANLPIDLTYSCEAGTKPTCGTCASCRDRKALGC